ncbi:4Fe-4S dicluster domain-containing protein [Thermoproteota archaeon]
MSVKLSRKEFLKLAAAPMVVGPMVLEGIRKGARSPIQEIGAQKAVLVDVRRCIGCKGCQIACKAWNKLPAEQTAVTGTEFTNPSYFSPITWKVVHFKEIGEYNSETPGTGGLKWRMLADNCKHCIEPSCVSVCPSGALWKRSDGPVLYDVNRCIGCGYCEMACPWGIPQFDEEMKSIRKCTMCFDRIDQGLEPACVATCPTNTIQFMTLEEAKNKASEADAGGLHVYGLNEVGGTSWIYISDVSFSEFGLPELDAIVQKDFEASLLTRFAGIGLLVGGVLIAASKIYAERKETISSEKTGGGT